MRRSVITLREAAVLSVLTLCMPSARAQDAWNGAPPADAPGFPGLQSSDAGEWTRFTDPNENAFSLDVPVGWRAEGGLVRRGPIDVSMFLRALSPDGTVLLVLGDPGPAVFHTPGFDNRGQGQPYRPGLSYARLYAEQALAPLCAGLRYVSGADRPDLANGPLAGPPGIAQRDAGEATFACTHGGKPASAYIYASTYYLRTPMPAMSAIWGVSMLAGCIAPADQVAAMKRVLLHMVTSARLDPQWARRQQAVIDQATRMINGITAAQQQAFEHSMARARAQERAMTQQFDAFDQVITGTGTFADPSGRRYELDNTQPYHWVRPGGQTAQTAGPTPPPGYDWQRLQQVPPQ